MKRYSITWLTLLWCKCKLLWLLHKEIFFQRLHDVLQCCPVSSFGIDFLRKFHIKCSQAVAAQVHIEW
jgi:hypothetical protein